MRFCSVDPFIRFAEVIRFKSPGIERYVRDCRIFYILSGKARICIEDLEYDMAPHSVFYCSAGSRYKIISGGMELMALDFDLTQDRNTETVPFSPIKITEGITLPPAEDCTVEDCDILGRHLFLPDGMAYLQSLRGIVEEFSARKPLYRENCSAMLKSVLVQLVRHSTEFTTQAASAVQKISAYIEENYRSFMSNELFAEMTGYHPSHLNRLFLRQTGRTLRQHILSVRMAQAKKLLLSTDLPLSAVAEQTGFNNSTYFSSYFKKTVGMSPMKFRSRFKNSI